MMRRYDYKVHSANCFRLSNNGNLYKVYIHMNQLKWTRAQVHGLVKTIHTILLEDTHATAATTLHSILIERSLCVYYFLKKYNLLTIETWLSRTIFCMFTNCTSWAMLSVKALLITCTRYIQFRSGWFKCTLYEKNKYIIVYLRNIMYKQSHIVYIYELNKSIRG